MAGVYKPMTETMTPTEAVGHLISLAKEVEIKDPIDWTQLTITEDQCYEMMATNVINQIYGIPETILIDSELKILKKYIGPLNIKDVNEIRKLVKK